MMLVRVDGRYINPDHITMLQPVTIVDPAPPSRADPSVTFHRFATRITFVNGQDIVTNDHIDKVVALLCPFRSTATEEDSYQPATPPATSDNT